jgi:hypothetical protein
MPAWTSLEPALVLFDVEAEPGTTLGSHGRNVVLEKKWGAPTFTNDGVSIASANPDPDARV